MGELRRNLLTRKWVVYSPEAIDIDSLTFRKSGTDDLTALFPADHGECPFCPKSAVEDPRTVISADPGSYTGDDYTDHHGDWRTMAVSVAPHMFRIEDNLDRRCARLYDIMGSRGAHESIVLTPQHGIAPWELDPSAVLGGFRMMQRRMRDLNRDERLGHPFAWLLYGQDSGGAWNHPVIDLVKMPFVPDRVQRELPGAREWYRQKQRCLFCDMMEEEFAARENGRTHRLIAETDRVAAYIPFFAESPFETWIQPLEHYSDFTTMPEPVIDDLARVLHMVLRRMFTMIGPFAHIINFMHVPNDRWNAHRGFWQTLQRDWHWRIQVVPAVCSMECRLEAFYRGTETRVNPLMPEAAADRLRG